MTFLCNLSHSNSGVCILLSDISLDCWPWKRICTLSRKYWVSARNILFINVSADFISAFFLAIGFNFGKLQLVSFHNCVIPKIATFIRNILDKQKFLLELVDIPYTGDDTTQPSNSFQQRDPGGSLYNVIKAFPALEVRILRCQGVNDRFLCWLSGDGCAELEAQNMLSLVLHDCTNFTAIGICHFLVNRHRRVQSEAGGTGIPIRTLVFLEVYGKGPAIYEVHAAILEEHNLKRSFFHKAHVSWNVERTDSSGPSCAREIQPLNLERSIWNHRTRWGLELW